MDQSVSERFLFTLQLALNLLDLRLLENVISFFFFTRFEKGIDKMSREQVEFIKVSNTGSNAD